MPEARDTPHILNQYSAITGGAFNYDANGNLAVAHIYNVSYDTYAYDPENRLVVRNGAGASWTLRYDPLGRLHEIASPSGARRFLYDGDELIAEYDTAGNMLRRYVHRDGAGDDPLVWYEGSTVADSARRYLFSDERGSITAVTDTNGNVIAVNTYDEYGIPGPGNTGAFQYTGQVWLPELGMYYYKARMYSPTLGRFMQTDPIGYGDGMNLYAYVGNDPVNGVDPSGEVAWCGQTGVDYGAVTGSRIARVCNGQESGNDLVSDYFNRGGASAYPPFTSTAAVGGGGGGGASISSYYIPGHSTGGWASADASLFVATATPGRWVFEISGSATAHNYPMFCPTAEACAVQQDLLAGRDDVAERQTERLEGELKAGAIGLSLLPIGRVPSVLAKVLGPSSRIFGDTAFGAARQGRLNQGYFRVGFGRHAGRAVFRIGIGNSKRDLFSVKIPKR